MPQIVRGFELKVGDIFVKLGQRYVITRQTETEFVYFVSNGADVAAPEHRMGRKSKERVELVGRRNKTQRGTVTRVYDRDWNLLGEYPSKKAASNALGWHDGYVKNNLDNEKCPYRFEVEENKYFAIAI